MSITGRMAQETMNDQFQAYPRTFFRIREVFEQEGFSIIKVEGDISTDNFFEWSEKLGQVLAETPLPMVLDFSWSVYSLPEWWLSFKAYSGRTCTGLIFRDRPRT